MLGPEAVVVVVMGDTLREGRAEVKPAVRPHRLVLFRRASARRGGLLVAHAWLTIAVAAALYVARPSALTLALAIVIIGAWQLGLLGLMHEPAHWLLFPQARLNTWVGTWLCAAPLGADLRQYRRRHHLHHRHTQPPEGPDLMLSARWPLARPRLALALLGDLGGFTALTRIASWRRPDGLAVTWRRLGAPLVAHAVLFGICAAMGGWMLYLVLWVLPRATWHQVVTRIRDIAELIVFVPCWKLPRVHALLLARDLGGRMERASSYAEVLARAGG